MEIVTCNSYTATRYGTTNQRTAQHSQLEVADFNRRGLYKLIGAWPQLSYEHTIRTQGTGSAGHTPGTVTAGRMPGTVSVGHKSERVSQFLSPVSGIIIVLVPS